MNSMEFDTVKLYLNITTVLFGLLAAILWLYSSTLKVSHKEKVDKSGWALASIQVDGNDFIKTIQKQSYWSTLAAIAAAAALLQAILLTCNDFF